MTYTMALVAFMGALFSGCHGNEAEGEADVAVKEEGRLLDPQVEGIVAPFLALAVPVILTVIVILGVVFYFYELARALEEHLYDDYDYYGDYTILQRSNQPTKRSVASDGWFNFVMKSIDPVETTFTLLQVGSVPCRKRAVCEIQRTASSVPVLGSLLHQYSRSISSLERYWEAQDYGAALEDCALLFSECPTSSLWGHQGTH